jgi:hypothetical protein
MEAFSVDGILAGAGAAAGIGLLAWLLLSWRRARAERASKPRGQGVEPLAFEPRFGVFELRTTPARPALVEALRALNEYPEFATHDIAARVLRIRLPVRYHGEPGDGEDARCRAAVEAFVSDARGEADRSSGDRPAWRMCMLDYVGSLRCDLVFQAPGDRHHDGMDTVATLLDLAGWEGTRWRRDVSLEDMKKRA